MLELLEVGNDCYCHKFKWKIRILVLVPTTVLPISKPNPLDNSKTFDEKSCVDLRVP